MGMSRAAIENDIIDGSGEGGKGKKGGEPKTEGVKEALKAAECKKVLKVGKVVSCVDWLIEEGMPVCRIMSEVDIEIDLLDRGFRRGLP